MAKVKQSLSRGVGIYCEVCLTPKLCSFLLQYIVLIKSFSISNQYLSSYNFSSLSQCLVEMEQLFSIFLSKPFMYFKMATSVFSHSFLACCKELKRVMFIPLNSVSFNWHLVCYLCRRVLHVGNWLNVLFHSLFIQRI